MTEKYAVIDLGSNSFRLEIGHFDGRKLVSDHYVKETVRLAAGFDSRGCLTEDTETRALASLARFGRLIRGIPLSRIRAVRTQALRIAKNSSDFLTRAEPVLGCPIHIIPGTEEALLTYLGCIKSLNPPTTDPILVIDIGGASTELSVGDGSRLCEATSFPIGCVNTTIASFSSRELNEQTQPASHLTLGRAPTDPPERSVRFTASLPPAAGAAARLPRTSSASPLRLLPKQGILIN